MQSVKIVTAAAILWLTLLSPAPAPAQLASSPAYEAWLQDGTRVSGPRLMGWFKAAADEPYLGLKVLKLHGNPENPLRLVRQEAASAPRISPPYLELANGDLLPGRVLACETAGPDADETRLVVSVDTSLTSGGLSTGRITVRAPWVVRIVGSPRAVAPAPPNVALGMGGEQIPYRSFRWMPDGVRLLTDQGVQLISYDSLGQLAPAGTDRIAALLTEAAQANAEGASFLMRVVTRHGAVLTSHRTERETLRRATSNRFRDFRDLRAADIELEYVQPAWSLSPLSFPVTDTLLRGFRVPHDIPLSLLPLETIEQRSLVGVPQTRAPNTSGSGGWLSAGDRIADLGLATRSRTVLRVTLPPGAKSFSGWVGLDRSVGPGGCIVAEVYQGVPSGTPLWSSGFLQGKDGPRRVDPLPLDDITQLTLVTDFGHEGRPAGADPLDIRDEATWLSPTVQVDDELLESPERWRGLIPGWQGWTLPEEMPRELMLTSRWSALDSRWESIVSVGESSPLILRRKVTIAPYANDILELQVAALAQSGYRESRILQACELRVEDKIIFPTLNNEKLRVTDDSLRVLGGRRGIGRTELVGTLSVWWDLQAYRGREVELILTIPRPENGEMLWRDLRFRGAAARLAGGQPALPDVPLSAIKPLDAAAFLRERTPPTPDALPGDAGALTLVGQRFNSGYGMVRESKVTFPLRPEFKRFVALVGSAMNKSGALRVLIDDEPVWTHPVIDSVSGGREVSLAIPAGAKRLTLESGVDGSYSGYTVWANAGFMTK